MPLLPIAVAAVPLAVTVLPIAIVLVPFATPPVAAKELSPVAWLPLSAEALSPFATPPLVAKELSPVADVVSIPPNATARLPFAVTQPRAIAPP